MKKVLLLAASMLAAIALGTVIGTAAVFAAEPGTAEPDPFWAFIDKYYEPVTQASSAGEFETKRLIVRTADGKAPLIPGNCEQPVEVFYTGSDNILLMQFNTYEGTQAAYWFLKNERPYVDLVIADRYMRFERISVENKMNYDPAFASPINTGAAEQTGIRGYAAMLRAAPSGNRQVNVAVIDSALDLEHPIFDGRLIIPLSYAPSKNDDMEHGTTVAGVIAGCTPEFVKIVPFPMRKFGANERGSSLSELDRQIRYALEFDETVAKIDIINISQILPAMGDEYKFLERSISAAQARGILIVAAAGNGEGGGRDVKTLVPAALGGMDAVMTVTSTGLNGREITSYDYGSEICLRAPAEGILTALPARDTDGNLTKDAEGNHVNMGEVTGTSMGAALTSAAAALLKYSAPYATGSMIKSQMVDKLALPLNVSIDPGGDMLGDLGRYGSGILFIGGKPTTYETAYLTGIYDPVQGSLFRPGDPLTRMEAAELLYKLMAKPSEEYTSDVFFWDMDDFYAENPQLLNILNFVSRDSDLLPQDLAFEKDGYPSRYMGPNPENTFNPDEHMPRGEVAAFLTTVMRYPQRYRGGVLPAELRVNLPYSDIHDHWARNYIYLAVVNGAMTGFPDGTFRPEDPITREETAALIHNIFKRSLSPQNSDRVFADVPPDHEYYDFIMNAALPPR
jgi:subtilisin